MPDKQDKGAAALSLRMADGRDDPEKIGAVYLRSWQSAYRGLLPSGYLAGLTASRWRPALAADGRRTAVACDGGRVVGVCSFGRDRRDAALGEIVSLYLLPEWIGRGAGARLLCFALDALAADGFRTARLWVLAGNARARGFYERFGFVRGAQTLEDRIGGRQVLELEYRRALRAQSGAPRG